MLVLPLLLFIGGFIAYTSTVHVQTKISSSAIVCGVNVDMTAMIPNTVYTIKTANDGNFFTLAAHLGINTIRITDIRWETTGEEYSRNLWHYVFDQATRYHIHIILLLEDGGDYTAIQQAHTLLDEYGLAHSPALWLIDLYNEPDLSSPQLMTTIRQEAVFAHHIAPKIPVTLGGWKSAIPGQPGKFDWQNPTDVSKFIHLVDIISPHLYEFEQGASLGFTPRQWTERFLQEVRKKSLHKPILLEEFGASNGLAPTNQPATVGGLAWQTTVYREVLQEVASESNQGVIGAVSWIFAPRPSVANPGVANFEGDMTGWSLVLNHGERLLPAAKEFSLFAHAVQ